MHLAASKGYEAITYFLIQEGVDVNISDNFGSTPLLEALKNGHDRVASVLVKEGASLKINDAGSFLCTVIAKGDSDFLKRLLSNGVDPNSKDYDHRTPLHVAASEGLYLMAKLLLQSGASIIDKDRAELMSFGLFLFVQKCKSRAGLGKILSSTPSRWENTPLDEARMCGNKNLIKLLEDAQFSQLPEFPSCTRESTDKKHRRKCTVFPFHPWESKDQRRPGIVLWVPKTMEELIKTASEKLYFPSSCCALTEVGGKVLDADMISDDQKLYLISQTH